MFKKSLALLAVVAAWCVPMAVSVKYKDKELTLRKGDGASLYNAVKEKAVVLLNKIN